LFRKRTRFKVSLLVKTDWQTSYVLLDLALDAPNDHVRFYYIFKRLGVFKLHPKVGSAIPSIVSEFIRIRRIIWQSRSSEGANSMVACIKKTFCNVKRFVEMRAWWLQKRYPRLIIVIIALCHGSLERMFGQLPNTLIAKVMHTFVKFYWMKRYAKTQTTLNRILFE
jgi:hypothetical protein